MLSVEVGLKYSCAMLNYSKTQSTSSTLVQKLNGEFYIYIIYSGFFNYSRCFSAPATTGTTVLNINLVIEK